MLLIPHRYAKDRFLFLLICILIFLIIGPLVEAHVGLRAFMDIFKSSVLLFSIYSISHKKRYLFIGASLALPFFVSIWMGYFIKIPAVEIAGNCFGIIFVGFTIHTIISYMLSQTDVTRDMIFAAVVVYLLMAVMWALIYLVIEGIHSGSFLIANEPLKQSRLAFFYYSFVTLTTLGYGDITPQTPFAGCVSVLEAVIGQVYLVCQVAWLVGMHVSRSHEKLSRRP